MFDNLTLKELEEHLLRAQMVLLSNLGVDSFSLPDGVTLRVDKTNAVWVIEQITASIKRKRGHGGRFIGASIR